MPMEIIRPKRGYYTMFGDWMSEGCPFCDCPTYNNGLCNCYPPFRWATFTDNELKGYRFVGD